MEKAVDFIYSNSLDHSYNPALCVKNWMSCISKIGLCFIHWGEGHLKVKPNQVDCFSGSLETYKELCADYNIVSTIETSGDRKTVILIVANK